MAGLPPKSCANRNLHNEDEPLPKVLSNTRILSTSEALTSSNLPLLWTIMEEEVCFMEMLVKWYENKCRETLGCYQTDTRVLYF